MRHYKLAPTFCFSVSFESFEHFQCNKFLVKKIDPYFFVEVVNKYYEVSVSSKRYRFKRLTNVNVYEL